MARKTGGGRAGAGAHRSVEADRARFATASDRLSEAAECFTDARREAHGDPLKLVLAWQALAQAAEDFSTAAEPFL